MPAELLPAATKIGGVRLAVSNLSRSLQFYAGVLGLRVASSTDRLASMTAQDSHSVLLELEEIAGVKPIERGSRLGLYHFAILLPTRSTLASLVDHLHASRVPFGSSDHLVSEALYLADPDGIQIEIYADRPRAEWSYRNGEVELAAEPLRFGELLALPHRAWGGMPAGAVIGHMHFFVDDLEWAQTFYCDGLGFDVVHASYPGVLFISAGGYHHHVELNTWAKNARPVKQTDARLLSWELVLESDSQVAAVRKRLLKTDNPGLVDPWGSQVLLRAEREQISKEQQ